MGHPSSAVHAYNLRLPLLPHTGQQPARPGL